VNSDLIKNKKSIVIKLGTCIVNVLSVVSKILHSHGIKSSVIFQSNQKPFISGHTFI
jgi:hypothetical protein